MKRYLAPLTALLFGVGARQFSPIPPDRFVDATGTLSEAEQQELEAAPALAVANATWAFGSVESVRGVLNSEIARLPESAGPLRARAFIRFGIIDTNPDGQAAVFAQACAADAAICENPKAAVERELALRQVGPGNELPMFLTGHPHESRQ